MTEGLGCQTEDFILNFIDGVREPLKGESDMVSALGKICDSLCNMGWRQKIRGEHNS